MIMGFIHNKSESVGVQLGGISCIWVLAWDIMAIIDIREMRLVIRVAIKETSRDLSNNKIIIYESV